MKKITLFLSTLYTISGLSQNSDNRQFAINYDPNGIPTSAVSVNNYQQQEGSVSAPYGYSDVRAMSEINSTVGDSYPWISGDGLRLYYSSGNGTINNILYCDRPDISSNFSPPTIVPLNAGVPISIWLSADELDAYVCTDPLQNKLLYYHRPTITSPFGPSTQITLLGVPFTYFTDASLDVSQNELFLYMSPKVIRRFDRISATTFALSSSVPFSTGITPGPGQLSKSNLEFSLSIETSDTTANLQLFSRNAPTDSFDGTGAGVIQGLNDSSFNSHLQPTMSDNNEWIVFVRNNNGIYTGNDLYIARNELLAVADPKGGNNYISMYPNPTSGEINFKWNKTLILSQVTIEIYHASGQSILKQNATGRLDLSKYSKGIYFVKICGPDFSEVKKLILK